MRKSTTKRVHKLQPSNLLQASATQCARTVLNNPPAQKYPRLPLPKALRSPTIYQCEVGKLDRLAHHLSRISQSLTPSPSPKPNQHRAQQRETPAVRCSRFGSERCSDDSVKVS